MLAAYANSWRTRPDVHPKHDIPVTSQLERVNKEIKRRTNPVGIFPNGEAVIRLFGALMLEQNDEWAVSRRLMPVAKLTAVCKGIATAKMIAAQ